MRRVIMAFVAAAVLASCSAAQTGKDIAIDCSKQAVQQQVAIILPTVLSILTGGAQDWEAQLQDLAVNLGATTLACAVKEAADHLRGTAPAAGPSQASTQAIIRSARVIHEHGWVYK